MDIQTLWAILYGGRFIVVTFPIDVNPYTPMEVSYYPETKYGLILKVHYEVKYPLVARIVRLFERFIHRGKVYVEVRSNTIGFGDVV